MNEKKKNSKTISIISLIVVILLVGYIVFDKVLNNDQNSNSTAVDSNSSNTTNNVESSLKELDINSDFVKSLVKYVPEVGEGVYSKYDVLLNSLKDSDDNYDSKMLFADMSFNSNSTKKSISAKNFESNFKKIWGPDSSYVNKTFVNSSKDKCLSYDSFGKYVKNKKEYQRITANCGGDIPGIRYLKLFKANQNNDIIETYWYSFYSGPIDDEKLQVCDSKGVCGMPEGIFISSSEEPIYNLGIDPADNLADFDKYKDKITTIYKITFTKQSDGNYYMSKGELQ